MIPLNYQAPVAADKPVHGGRPETVRTHGAEPAELKPIKYGDHMTLEEWRRCPWQDGHACWATEEGVSQIGAPKSLAGKPDWATHVVYYWK